MHAHRSCAADGTVRTRRTQVLRLCRAAAAGLALALIAACSGSSSGGGGTAATKFTIGGSASGLSGTLVLQDEGSDNLTLTQNGAFTFATGLANGAAYAVTVLTPPSGETCTVTHGSGTVSAANVTDVAVTCSASGGGGGGTGGLSAPANFKAVAGHKQITLTWTRWPTRPNTVCTGPSILL